MRQSQPAIYNLSFPILIITVILLVYCNSFDNSFVYDDHPMVVENEAIRSLGIRNIISNFTEWKTRASNIALARDVWRPLTTTSFAIDYKFWGLDARYYHIENVVLHIINALLVYALIVLISDSVYIAFIASLIFSIHPIQTEVVTWISGRPNLLFLLFFLLSLIFHIRNIEHKNNGLNHSLSLIFFTCSLLSKEMAVTLPFILMWHDVFFLGAKKVRYRLGYYLPFFLIEAFYLFARFSVLGAVTQKTDWWGDALSYNILTMIKVIAGYIRLLLIPINLRTQYSVNISKSIFDPDVLFALLILATAILFWSIFRRKRDVSFFIGWFFITLIPVYNIVPFTVIMAERFLYLPSISFAVISAVFFSKSIDRLAHDPAAKRAVMLAAAAVFVMYGMAVIFRNMEWKDDITFYAHETLRSPANPYPHYCLGYAYAKKARETLPKELSDSYRAAAIKEFQKAIFLNPEFQLAYIDLANSYNAAGLYKSAIENFKKALGIAEDCDIYNNLSVAYYHEKMYDEAIDSCRRSIILTPDHRDAYVNLGNAYFAKHEYAKAKKAWAYAIKLGSGFSSLLNKVKELEKGGY